MPLKRPSSTHRKNGAPKKTERLYTRADVVAFFNDTFGKKQDPTYELQKVSLLPQIDPPAWEVEYKGTYRFPSGNHYYYSSFVLLQLTNGVTDTPYLNLAHTEELPADLATPQEEDTEIARRAQAVYDAWFSKQKQMKTAQPTTEPVSQSSETVSEQTQATPIDTSGFHDGQGLNPNEECTAC